VNDRIEFRELIFSLQVISMYFDAKAASGGTRRTRRPLHVQPMSGGHGSTPLEERSQ
jgi:hypothetical protein